MQQSSDISVFEQDLEDFTDEDGRIRLGPDGPFFVNVHYSAEEDPSPEKEQPTAPTATALMEVEFRNDEGRAVLHISNPQSSNQPNPRPSRASSQEGEDSETSSSSLPFLASSSQDIRTPKMTDVPWVQTLSLNTSTDGKQTLSYTRRHVAHTQSLYAIAPEPDQTAALISNLRSNIKGNPEHALYLRLLASCEAVEQESRERRGDGLLSFEEFEEVLKNGRLRFLESWMDWVSL
jgi:hypothetical protein